MASENCFFVSGKSLKLVETTVFKWDLSSWTVQNLLFGSHWCSTTSCHRNVYIIHHVWPRHCCAGTLFTSLRSSFTLWIKGGGRYSFISKKKKKKGLPEISLCNSCGGFTVGARLSLGLQPLPVEGETAGSSRWMTTVVARPCERARQQNTRR